MSSPDAQENNLNNLKGIFKIKHMCKLRYTQLVKKKKKMIFFLSQPSYKKPYIRTEKNFLKKFGIRSDPRGRGGNV